MIWIFGYGSLIWRPGFSFLESRPARLEGYHRAFCRYSFRHRGTPEQPGLVVGLREGGACLGMAFAVRDGNAGAGSEADGSPGAGNEAEVLAYLDEREGAGYTRHALPVEFVSGTGPAVTDHAGTDKNGTLGWVNAWTYVPDPRHPSYFGEEDPVLLVERVALGEGESGTALDYLRELIRHLEPLGAEEPHLADVLARAEKYREQYRGEDGG